MRLKLSLLAAMAFAGAAGLVQAAQTPPPASNGPPPSAAPSAPEPEEPPPGPAAPAPPSSQPAPTAAETPATSESKSRPLVAEKPAEPTRRSRSGAAIIQAIDKVTAETLRFEAPIGQPIRYKTLVFTVRACETTAADEASPDSVAYLTIESQPRSLTGRAPPAPKSVFKGWMFASSPGLNPLQHPVYDAWLIACRAP